MKTLILAIVLFLCGHLIFAQDIYTKKVTITGAVEKTELVKLADESIVIGTHNFAADAEASDTYVIVLSPIPDGYMTGSLYSFTANTANTGSASLNVNGLGAKTILKLHDLELATGDIEAGQIVVVIYDGVNLQMISQLAQ